MNEAKKVPTEEVEAIAKKLNTNETQTAIYYEKVLGIESI